MAEKISNAMDMGLDTWVSKLWQRIVRYPIILAAAAALSIASNVSLAEEEYKPTYTPTRINSPGSGHTSGSSSVPKMTFKDYINTTPNQPGWTHFDRVLGIGFGNGIKDAQNLMDQKFTDPYGRQFDIVLPSNVTSNKLESLARSITGFIGVSLMGPGARPDIQRIQAREYWAHSQACMDFINLSNAGLLKVQELNLIAPPMEQGAGYFNNLQAAASRAGVQKINIYQNREDIVTRNPFPNIKLTSPSGSSIVGLGFKLNFGGSNIPIDQYVFHSTPGQDKIYLDKDNSWVRVHDLHMSASGHELVNPNNINGGYYPNIAEITKREQFLPPRYTGLTANVNMGGSNRVVNVAPPDYYLRSTQQPYVPPSHFSPPPMPRNILPPDFSRFQNPIPSFKPPVIHYIPPNFGNMGNFNKGYMMGNFNKGYMKPPVTPPIKTK